MAANRSPEIIELLRAELIAASTENLDAQLKSEIDGIEKLGPLGGDRTAVKDRVRNAVHALASKIVAKTEVNPAS